MRTSLIAALIGVIALLSLRADGARPGDLLSGLDRARESASSALARSPRGRWEALIRRAGERLTEAEAARTAGDVPAARASATAAASTAGHALEQALRDASVLRGRALEAWAQEMERLRAILSWMEASDDAAPADLAEVAQAMATLAGQAQALRTAGLPSPVVTITTPVPTPAPTPSPSPTRRPSPSPRPRR